MNADVAIEDQLRDLLLRDQRISDPGAIAVSANHGLVTLRGTVGRFGARRAAVKDAAAWTEWTRSTTSFRSGCSTGTGARTLTFVARPSQSLEWDSTVPAERFDVEVAHGWITLTGDAYYQFQSDAAFDDVARLHGVIGITNEIRVTSP